MVVHSNKLRWLAWLRVQMLIRSFRRSPRSLILAIVGLLVILFVSGLLAIALFAAFQNLSAPANTEILYLLLTGILLLWIMLPLLSYSTNEGLDVTKLQLFPLTRFEVMFSLLFSSLFDLWTVLLLVLFAVTIVAWWLHSLALGLMTLLILVVFYFVIVGISQLILALLMRTLQSRKFRDISVIILALFGSSCYLLQRFAIGAHNLLNLGNTLNRGGFSPVLQWLPSGVAATAIRAASQGNWTTSFALFGLLLVIAVIAIYLWQVVLERSMAASETGASRRKKQRQPAVARPVVVERVDQRTSQTRLGEQLQGLLKKELLCFWRDPQLKIRIFQIAIYVVIFVLLPAFNASNGSGGDSFYASYTPFTSVAVVFLFMLTLSQNTLGIERQSLTTLFLFPIDRRRLLWGKNLAVFLIGFVVLVALMIVCLVISHEQTMVLPAAVIGLSGLGITLGWGNFASTYFPRYQAPMGQRGYSASGGQAQSGGCLNIIMSLVMTVITIVTLVPVALGIGIPFFMNLPLLWLGTMPLSLVYGVVLYVVLTNLSATRMLATEPEILATTTRS
jgi:ABC-2 type transport system permease protein